MRAREEVGERRIREEARVRSWEMSRVEALREGWRRRFLRWIKQLFLDILFLKVGNSIQ